MPKTLAERVEVLRSGYTSALADPSDLFGARMMIHEAFEEWGVNTNEIARLLLPTQAPITMKHLQMLDMVPMMIEVGAAEGTLDPLKICKIIRMLTI